MDGGSGGTGSGEVADGLKEYQGKYVDIGLDINDSKKEDGTEDTTDDWEIFYATKDRIFLIAADYVPVTKLKDWGVMGSGTTLNTNGVTSSRTYGVCWSTPKNFSSVLPDLTEVMHTGYSLETNKGNPNSIAVSDLLDTTAWEGIKTAATERAKIGYVIGGPTLEMWCAAWNEAVGADDETFKQIQPDGAGSTGYYVGCTATNQTKKTCLFMNGTTSSLGSNLSTLGSSYPLFFPRTESVSSCYGFWLASPSAESNGNLFVVYYDGSVTYSYGYNCTNFGVRPVVCLESGVSLVESAGTGKYTLSN